MLFFLSSFMQMYFHCTLMVDLIFSEVHANRNMTPHLQDDARQVQLKLIWSSGLRVSQAKLTLNQWKPSRRTQPPPQRVKRNNTRVFGWFSEWEIIKTCFSATWIMFFIWRTLTQSSERHTSKLLLSYLQGAGSWQTSRGRLHTGLSPQKPSM